MIQSPRLEATAFEIPIVDLSPDLETVGAALDSAYSNIGFCQIIGHGLDPELEASAWALAQEFFALPQQEKALCSIPAGDAYGYGHRAWPERAQLCPLH